VQKYDVKLWSGLDWLV